MSTPPTSPPVPQPATRAVLLWHPERDESQVVPGIEQAALLLNVPADAVRAAIDAGDMLRGWFVDWQV